MGSKQETLEDCRLRANQERRASRAYRAEANHLRNVLQELYRIQAAPPPEQEEAWTHAMKKVEDLLGE